MRTIDPDTAQEYIDDAVREAERAADVAIADLKAELEQTRYDLRIARHLAANHESLEDQWMAASRRILEMQSAVIDATTEREALRAEIEDLRAQVKELEPLRPLLNVLRSIHESPGQNVPQMGHPIYWTFGGVTLIASGAESDRLTHALSCAVFDTLLKDVK